MEGNNRQILEDLNRSHQGLQHLQLQPTETNLAILMDAMQTMRVAHGMLTKLLDMYEPQETSVEAVVPEQAGELDAT